MRGRREWLHWVGESLALTLDDIVTDEAAILLFLRPAKVGEAQHVVVEADSGMTLEIFQHILTTAGAATMSSALTVLGRPLNDRTKTLFDYGITEGVHISVSLLPGVVVRPQQCDGPVPPSYA